MTVCFPPPLLSGELSLSGEVRPVQGVLPMTIMAQKMGLSEIYVPTDNVREASVVEGIKAYGVRSLRELVFHFEKGGNSSCGTL